MYTSLEACIRDVLSERLSIWLTEVDTLQEAKLDANDTKSGGFIWRLAAEIYDIYETEGLQ